MEKRVPVGCMHHESDTFNPSVTGRNGIWVRQGDEILDGVRKALPLDAILLSLHGSMRVKGIGKAEGDILSRIRDICPYIQKIPFLSVLL